MPMLPSASHREFPVISAAVTPTTARNNPSSAPVSSSSTTGSSGLFERLMYCHHDAPPRPAAACFTAVRNDRASSTMATPRTASAIGNDSSAWGWTSLSIPSTTANNPPSENSIRATMKAQK